MRKLRNTTALVLGLTALSPAMLAAQALPQGKTAQKGMADARACIDAGMADGQDRDAAAATCATAPGTAAERIEGEKAGSEKTEPEKTEAEERKAPEGEVGETGADGAPPAAALPAEPAAQDAKPAAAPAATPDAKVSDAPEARAPEADAAEADVPEADAPTPDEMNTEVRNGDAPPREAAPEADRKAEPEAAQSPATTAEQPAKADAAKGPAPEEPKPGAEPQPARPSEPAPQPARDAEPEQVPEQAPERAQAPREGKALTNEGLAAAINSQLGENADPQTRAAAENFVRSLTGEPQADQGQPITSDALAAEDDSPRPQAQVSEEVVTESTARSASEEFGNAVNAQPQSRDDRNAFEKMSTLEKAALAGLGALAVGAVLNNGSEVAVNSGDRVVLAQPDGSYRVIKDDGALLRQPGTRLESQRFDDGYNRTVSTKPDNSQVITVYDPQGRVVRRTLVEADGTRYVLVDDSQGAAPIEAGALPEADVTRTTDARNEQALRDALAAQARVDRGFTLAQIRDVAAVRALAPAVAVENVTFETGSAAIRPEQARELADLGQAIRERIAENPREVFLVEGHTDAVGNAAYNLALSDRRAETLALALTEYFDVPAENLIVQGYGEQFLKVQTGAASEENRRATVRRVTDLLQVASSN